MKYFLTGLFLWTFVVLAAVEVDIRPSQPMAGEVFQVLLTAAEDYPVPVKLPEVSGIQWLTNSTSRSYRNINGKASHTLGIGAVAAKAGTYQIPSFQVKTGKRKTENTEVLTLKIVADEAAADSVNQQTAIFGNIRLPEKERSFYLGEEIDLYVDLFIRNDTPVTALSYPDLQIPHAVFRDFRQENPENPRFAQPSRRMRAIDGVRYTVLSFRTAFRSIAAGEVTPAGSVTVEVAAPQKRRSRSRDAWDEDIFGGFFGSRQTVSRKVVLSSPGPLTFQKLPPVPADTLFTGLVGNWQMRFSLDRPDGCKVGEVMTLRLRLAGDGLTDLLKLPEIKLPGFRIYPPEIRKEPGGVNVLWQIIPLKAGENRLQLTLATFDPRSGKYQTASLDQRLKAAPADRLPESAVVAAPQKPSLSDELPEAEEPQTAPHTSLQYLKHSPGAVSGLPDGRDHLLLYLCLLIAGPLVWGMSEIWFRRRERLAGSESLRRKRTAKAGAGAVFRRLDHAANEAEWNEIFRREVPVLLADHFDLPPGSTPGELAEKTADPVLAAALRNAGENAYLPGQNAGEPADRKRVMKALKKLLALVVFFAIVPLAADDFTEAGKAYDNGDFARAETLYSNVLRQRGASPGVLYNLGCAAYMNGRPAAALAYFDGARRLAPRDSAALENLNVTHARLGQNPEGQAASPGELLVFCRDMLRPDGWLFIGCLAWCFFFLALALRRMLPKPVLHTVMSVAAVFLLTALAAYFAQLRSVYAPDRAFVLDGGTQMRSLPAGAGTPEGGIAAGQEVQVLEERGNYYLIRCGHLQGWIPAKDCRKVF